MERGERLTQKPRKNKVYGENRVCEHEGCDQILSKYNQQEYCFVHHKFKAPRVRGLDVIDI